MKTIDVHDLPEPLVKAIESMIRTFREQIVEGRGSKKKPDAVVLPSWDGTVVGSLRRAEIYEDGD